eukprot:NODE_7102_length_1608_cov_9.758271.p1 GENE.NODE_7102_length_1608_cov_9.758271~~NODE_7102_length_1608_cov_9.758271.p1  ORF type:complete len:465 (-),score=169.91 NODE_7102_length_1608_cov_9.758271:213-1580(-)
MEAADEQIPDALLPYREKLTPRFFEVRRQVLEFQREVIEPRTAEAKAQYRELVKTVDHPTKCPEPPVMRELRAEAKRRGIMNLFLPEVCKLSVLEYSPIAEILGTSQILNVAMNCSAPDTGNMEVLERYGTPEQKKQWLDPLLSGEIRSAFAMTEPGVASSDASNICTRIEADGDDYVINGHKWYISGAMRPECKVFILLGCTSATGPLHKRHSMIIVPRDAPGIDILRPLAVFGHDGDHAEIIFRDVRVPKSNILLGEGRGFEIAQGRLGPGRIHHCMRSIGVAESALKSMVDRALRRKAFGRLLAERDAVRTAIAEARISITQCRQLCYLAAVVADERGFKGAKMHIAMLKVAAPRAALKIIDDAIQIHGAHGVSQDSMLPDIYTHMRTLRVADGPDDVHLRTIAQAEFAANVGATLEEGHRVSGTNLNVAKYGMFNHVEGGSLYAGGAKSKM